MEKKTKMKFNVLAVFAIIIFCFAITPKTLQNDTYYTIKIGEHIMQNGIDMKDPFSWHEDLPYTYPHWAYDVAIYQIYNFGETIGIGGFTAIYISTILLCILLGITFYFISIKLCHNELVSFFITLGVMYMMGSFIAARAQLVTYFLFIFEILFIEQFLKTKKIGYAIGLVILPIIIANVHSAVWPFYFVLFIPYIVEYILVVIIDLDLGYNIQIKWKEWRLKRKEHLKVKPEKSEEQAKSIEKLTNDIEQLQQRLEKNIQKREERRKNPYKLKLVKEKNAKWLILIMIICAFTGLLTPLGDVPYTYLIKTMQGNTMKSISEHLPLTLIENKELLTVFVMFLGIMILTDTKIRVRDFFMLGGLVLLTFMSRRQESMFLIICGFIFEKLLVAIFEKYDKTGTEKTIKAMTSFLGKTLTILLVILVSFLFYKGKMKSPFVNTSAYPVEASNYILENLDVENIKLYNEYNYGSYLLFRGIPVFIDSRADLYTPEFNGTKNEEGKYEGRDIFSDYINISTISTYYDDKFEKYGITHVMAKKASKLNMLISRDDRYEQIYEDKNFVIYSRMEEK